MGKLGPDFKLAGKVSLYIYVSLYCTYSLIANNYVVIVSLTKNQTP